MTEACLGVQELMPWVINGTATAREQAECWTHIAVCPQCRSELVRVAALYARVHRAVQVLGTRPQAAEPFPVVTRLLPILQALGLPAAGAGLLGGVVQLAVEGWRPSLPALVAMED